MLKARIGKIAGSYRNVGECRGGTDSLSRFRPTLGGEATLGSRVNGRCVRGPFPGSLNPLGSGVRSRLCYGRWGSGSSALRLSRLSFSSGLLLGGRLLSRRRLGRFAFVVGILTKSKTRARAR